MRAQRVRGGESRIEMQTVKWTAEGMGNGKRQVFHDVMFLYTIVLCLFPLSFFCGAFQESQIPLFRPTC